MLSREKGESYYKIHKKVLLFFKAKTTTQLKRTFRNSSNDNKTARIVLAFDLMRDILKERDKVFK